MFPRFIICSDPRTGGHMLATALNGHSQLCVAGEIFVRPELFGLPSRPTRVNRSPQFPQQVITAAWERYHGFLIHRRFQRGLELIGQERSVRIVFLRREDWLAQLASERVALQTGVWHVAPTGVHYLSDDGRDHRVAAPPVVTLSLTECRQYREAGALREAAALARLRDNPRLDITYERLTAEWISAINEIQDFLRVPREALAPVTQRQEQRPLSDVVENLAELREHFKDRGRGGGEIAARSG